jgi:hypothetical protein
VAVSVGKQEAIFNFPQLTILNELCRSSTATTKGVSPSSLKGAGDTYIRTTFDNFATTFAWYFQKFLDKIEIL